MIYIRFEFITCLLVLTLLTTIETKTHFDLREKLARLLLDPNYNDKENELEKPRTTYGMLLKDLRDRHLFHSSSEEAFYEFISRLGEHYDDTRVSSASSTKDSTTTMTTTPSTTTFQTTEIPLVGQSRQPIMMGIERLGSMVNRFIDLWIRS